MDETVELRSRNRAGPSGYANGAFVDDSKNHVDHKVAPTDTIQKIGLFYSVPVSEIKRVNNIMADHELYGLPQVRVPITRLRLHYLNELHVEQTGQPLVNAYGVSVPLVNSLNGNAPAPTNGYIKPPPEPKDCSSGSSTDDESIHSAKDKIDALLGKTDKTVQQVREQLPSSPGVESGGRFHFVDASAPDNASRGTWYLIFGVVVMFVVIPLLLTLLEEHNEAEVELQQHQHEREHAGT